MRRNWREAELIFLAMYAALPLFGSDSGSIVAVSIFESIMALLALRALLLRGQLPVPEGLLKATAFGFLIFVPVDAIFLSRSLITASTHLVFFIAIYQALDRAGQKNRAQRLLLSLLLCIISLATSTTLIIVFFIAGFAILTSRQLIELTHAIATDDAQTAMTPAPPKSAAFTYLAPTLLLAAALFPTLPRVHNPFVRGFSGALEGSATGLSDSIDFSVARSISADPTVVARVWMPQEAIPFFTPLRLRGTVYDAWIDRRWRASSPGKPRSLPRDRKGNFLLARPSGFSRAVTVQQGTIRERRLYLPVGTYRVSGVPQVIEYGQRSVYAAPSSGGLMTYRADLSRRILPLSVNTPFLPNYPISPRVSVLAAKIAGDARSPADVAQRIETYLSTRFSYVPDPATIGHAFSVDEFLLRERRGHCEYFAAGMVVLLEARGIPSRIIGGFYGGKLNPLTGYFTLQKSDAHAWVEVFDGEKWETYDPTPATLRPGNQKQGLFRVYAGALADSVNYFWDRYILTFGLTDQINLALRAIEAARVAVSGLRGTLQKVRLHFSATVFISVLALAILLMTALRALRRWRRPLYVRTLDELRSIGISIDDSTSSEEVLQEVERIRPDLAGRVRLIFEAYEVERFSTHPLEADARRRAGEAFRELVALA